MRYYSINLGSTTYTSLGNNGLANPGALNVELDLQVTTGDTLAGGSYCRIWGVGLQTIVNAKSLFGQTVQIYGGMSKGLPLANPAQAGLLGSGTVMQAFGNWEGLSQHLDLIFTATSSPPISGGPNPQVPERKISLNWTKGTKLTQALQQTLQTAFPGMTVNNKVSKDVTANQDQKAVFTSLEQLALYVRRYSQQLLGPTAHGISIAINDTKSVNLFDEQGTGTGNVAFQDLIGFPTWIQPKTLQVKTVMRADLKMGQIVTLPQTFTNASVGGGSNLVDQSLQALNGTFEIVRIRHIGNFRSPSGDAWCSLFDCTSTGSN